METWTRLESSKTALSVHRTHLVGFIFSAVSISAFVFEFSITFNDPPNVFLIFPFVGKTKRSPVWFRYWKFEIIWKKQSLIYIWVVCALWLGDNSSQIPKSDNSSRSPRSDNSSQATIRSKFPKATIRPKRQFVPFWRGDNSSHL